MMCDICISQGTTILWSQIKVRAGGELTVKEGNSCMAYKDSYIYNKNWVIQRYQGYTKADFMMLDVIYKVVNFLQMKSLLHTKSISQKEISPVVFKLRSKRINISPLVAPLQDCEEEILIIHNRMYIP